MSPSARSISARICSVHGSPPNSPSSRPSARASLPPSSTACAIASAYDGVDDQNLRAEV